MRHTHEYTYQFPVITGQYYSFYIKMSSPFDSSDGCKKRQDFDDFDECKAKSVFENLISSSVSLMIVN